MLVLFSGQAQSGKSLLAEDYLCSHSTGDRYYIATMQIMDEEGERRVQHHRAQREGKGFVTLEIPMNICDATCQMDGPGKSCVLLECVPNLAGNHMHADEGALAISDPDSMDGLIGRIIDDIMALEQRVSMLVAVTEVYAQDGQEYDGETHFYIRLVDMVNERLISLADRYFPI